MTRPIPEGWNREILGNHIQELSERANGKEIPVLSVTNSQGFVLSEEYFDKQVFSKDLTNYKRICRGVFAYNPSRLNVGSLAKLENFAEGLLSPMYVVFRNHETINPDYLSHWLRSDRAKALISASTQGTVRDSVSFSTLASFPVLLPPLWEQEKIAEILGSVDAAMAATRQVIDQTRTLKRTLMQDLLTKGIPGRHTRFKNTPLGPIPEAWEVVKLGDVAEVQTGIAKNGKLDLQRAVSVPYLRVANVQDGYLDLSEIKEILVEEHRLEKSLLCKGDVLFNEGGDADKLGRGCVWEGQIEPCTHQNHVFAVRCGRRISPYYLTLQAASIKGKRYFLQSSKQTTNLASINSYQLKAFPFPLPTVPEQEEIVSILNTVDARLTQEEQSLASLQELKNALMQELLSGALRVPQPQSVRAEVAV